MVQGRGIADVSIADISFLAQCAVMQLCSLLCVLCMVCFECRCTSRTPDTMSLGTETFRDATSLVRLWYVCQGGAEKQHDQNLYGPDILGLPDGVTLWADILGCRLALWDCGLTVSVASWHCGVVG